MHPQNINLFLHFISRPIFPEIILIFTEKYSSYSLQYNADSLLYNDLRIYSLSFINGELSYFHERIDQNFKA